MTGTGSAAARRIGAVLLGVWLATACGRHGFIPVRQDGELDDADVDPELVLRHDMDDDPGDGQVDDLSANELHATCLVGQTCPTSVAGLRGSALHFDGAGALLRVPHAPVLDTPTAFTVSVWVNADDLATQAVPVAKPYTGPRNSWVFVLRTPQPCFATTTEAGSDPRACQPGAASVQRWVHYAGTWNGATLRFFVDGLLAGEVTAAVVPFDDHDVVIGADENDGTLVFPWRGAIDELRIYRRALTLAEIAVLALPP